MAYSGSASDRLESVRAAIENCLTAQSYTTRGRGKVNANLKDLRDLERQLMDEVQQESGGGSMTTLAQPQRLT